MTKIALYFDPTQARDNHGRWSTLSGAPHLMRASMVAKTIAEAHDPLRTTAPRGDRGSHRATYHAAMAQHLINEHALGATIDEAALDGHLHELHRATEAMRVNRWRSAQDGSVFEHYRSMQNGLKAARRAGTGVHVVHHLGNVLEGATAAPAAAPTTPPTLAPLPTAAATAPTAPARAPRRPRAAPTPATPAAPTPAASTPTPAAPAAPAAPTPAPAPAPAAAAPAPAPAAPATRLPTAPELRAQTARGEFHRSGNDDALLHAAAHLDALDAARIAHRQGNQTETARQVAIADMHLAQYQPAKITDPAQRAQTEAAVAHAQITNAHVPGVIPTGGKTHTLGVPQPTRTPGPHTQADVRRQATVYDRAFPQIQHQGRRANMQHLLRAMSAHEDAMTALANDKPDEAHRQRRIFEGHLAHFDPAQIRADTDRAATLGTIGAARDVLNHGLHTYQPTPDLTPMKDAISALSNPEARMVTYGYQKQPVTGSGFKDARSTEIQGTVTDAEFQQATGCSTYSEFRRRILGDHPLIDHNKTTFRMRVSKTQDGKLYLELHSTLKDSSGATLGTMTRSAHQGRGEVHNDYLSLGDHVQGGGLSIRLYQSQEEAWKAAGYSHVTVQANISVGTYAWATHGFDYDPAIQGGLKAADHRRNLKNAIDKLVQNGKLSADRARIYHKLADHCKRPWDFARFVIHEPGLSTDEQEIGKNSLIRTHSWYGRKDLTDAHKGNRVSNATRRKKGLRDLT